MRPAVPSLGLLDGPRARGAFALRTVMRPPFGLRIASETPLSLIALVSGETWLIPDDGSPLRLRPGDVALTRGPEHYTVADRADGVADVIVHPGQRCAGLDGAPMHERMALGPRTWGNDPAGGTVFLVGAWEAGSEVSARLLRALPPVLVLSRPGDPCPLVPILCAEVAKDEPGQAAVLDRLLDLLLVAVLKDWFAREGAGPLPTTDPVVARALALVQRDVARPWSLALIAREVGASRATLARRFHDAVGEPPMAYVRNARLARAADLLCDPAETIATVAAKVGYASPFAFSVAFKRARGVSPQEHRRTARSLLQPPRA